MRSRIRLAVPAVLAVLACASMLSAQDLAPARLVVIPEAVWADATGGGTWVTELQVTVRDAGTTVQAAFAYGTLNRAVELLTTTVDFQTLYYPNILEAMQVQDPGFDYFGRVGTLVIGGEFDTQVLWAQAMTVNGHYGKTFPGIAFLDTTTANVGRNMIIPNLRQSATYRTFVGSINMNYGVVPMSVRFRLMSPSGAEIASFTKDFAAFEFKAFNPFFEAGLGSSEITNCWLLIEPITSAVTGDGSRGLMSFGSIANNYTNDTYALIAIPYVPPAPI